MTKKTFRLTMMISICLLIISGNALALQKRGKTDNTPQWFYPEWAARATYNQPINVLDTDGAVGRYSLYTKQIGLKDIVRIHGHLCDGITISYVEIKAVLQKLFPDGVVDRTDIRAVSKNGPCWVDAVTMMTGARINFETLRIDNSIGNGFIIQRISTGQAYTVHLKPGVFPEDFKKLTTEIRQQRAEGKPVTAEAIDRAEKMEHAFSRKLLNTEPEKILAIEHLPDYKFKFSDMFGSRSDIINKNMPR